MHLFETFFFFAEHNNWASGEADHFVAEATYGFTGENSDELSFKKGQYIKVAPKGTGIALGPKSNRVTWLDGLKLMQ